MKRSIKILSPKMQTALEKEIASLKRELKSGTFLVQHRLDFHSKFGIDEEDVATGMSSVIDNDFILERLAEEKEEEYEDSLQEKQDQIQRYFDKELFDEEKDFKPHKIDALDYMEQLTREKRKNDSF